MTSRATRRLDSRTSSSLTDMHALVLVLAAAPEWICIFSCADDADIQQSSLEAVELLQVRM